MDHNLEGTARNVLVLQLNRHIVNALVSGSVVHTVGTVLVVGDFSVNRALRGLDVDTEGMSTTRASSTLGVDSLDSELGGNVSLTALQTRTISLALAGISN